MPAYDYRCKECGNKFEQTLSMKDDKLPTTLPCPSCNKKDCVVKEITAPGLVDMVTLGRKKPDAGFQEVMSKIKQAHPGHRINDRW